jgi:hypothetical protein
MDDEVCNGVNYREGDEEEHKCMRMFIVYQSSGELAKHFIVDDEGFLVLGFIPN